MLTIRYSTYQTDEDVIFDSNYGQVCFKACKTAETVTVPLSRLEKGKFRLEMVSRGTEENGVMFDCLCITEAADREQIRFKMHKRNVIPTISYEGEKVKYEYHYGEKPIFLGLLNKRVRSRKLYSGCLEDAWNWKIKSGTAEDVSLNQEGKEYEFSARMMKTALFSNVVYPI